MVNGVFITFEGPDGAGKTTQIHLLANALRAEGRTVVLTREPGGTRIGDQIREILLNPEHTEMADRTEVLLYAAQRAQNVSQRIRPELEQGHIVLGDRFIDASIAYQAAGLGLDESVVRAASEFAVDGLKPVRTYLLDLSPEESRSRLLSRASAGSGASDLDRIELKPLDYHKRVREAFLRIAEAEPERVLRLDAALPQDQLASMILRDCKRFL